MGLIGIFVGHKTNKGRMKQKILFIIICLCFLFVKFGNSQTQNKTDSFSQKDEQFIIRKVSINTGDTIITVLLDTRKTNINSLQYLVDSLNRYTSDKEWEYRLSRMFDSPPVISKEYKFHWNKDGSSGITIYGEEIRQMPH